VSGPRHRHPSSSWQPACVEKPQPWAFRDLFQWLLVRRLLKGRLRQLWGADQHQLEIRGVSWDRVHYFNHTSQCHELEQVKGGNSMAGWQGTVWQLV